MMMVSAWMLHCMLLSALLTAAALVWERAARWTGTPVRWAWLVALGGSVTLPWLLRLVPPTALGDALAPVMPVLTLEPLFAEPAAGGASWSVLGVAAYAWLAVSLVALSAVVSLVWRLERSRRAWRPLELDGGRVWVTEDVGPAAIGVARGAVVVPTWVLELGAELRSLLLTHEREHVRAGDPRVLLGGLLLVAAMPWNPLVWVQFARLRNGIELDCDARVLRAGASPRVYGRLLLEVGRRRSGGALVMATFAEPHLFLEERIRRIARWPAPRRPVRAAAFGVLALALFATALSARDPVSGMRLLGDGLPTINLPGPLASDTPPAVPRGLEDGPTFTPMTVRPELRNIDEVRAALIRNYPPLLRDAGIGGVAMVWFLIDRQGDVQRALLSASSGHDALDAAALRVARRMEFSPAENNGAPVPVWVEIPIMFTPDSGPAEPATPSVPRIERAPIQTGPPPAGAPAPAPVPRVEAPEPAPAPAPAPARVERAPLPPDRAEAPTFTPMTERPELINQGEVVRALVRHYPPLLRDAGISGTPVIWFFIGEDGVVQRTQISKTSGHDALDAAALEVAGMMRFSPAKNRDRPVAVWVEIPIVFSARSARPDPDTP